MMIAALLLWKNFNVAHYSKILKELSAQHLELLAYHDNAHL
jgi:hypothetical protein